MTRKEDEIKPAPVVELLENGKENKKKNSEFKKEMMLLPKPNIQRASDQKRYYGTIFPLNYRGYSAPTVQDTKLFLK